MALTVKVDWRGPELTAVIKRQMAAGLDAWWVELQAIARKKASISNAGVRKKRTRTTSRGGKGSQYTIYPNSSKTGESPRRRSGMGQKGIVGGRSELAARVGYTKNVAYMLFHELGIRYAGGVQRRPTLVPAMRDNEKRLNRVFQKHAEAAG